MNYALLHKWVDERVDELVAFGVPRIEANALMKALECGAVNAESDARKENQFLLDFKRVGVAGLAERLRISPQAVWKRRKKILSKPNAIPSVDSMVD